MNDPSSQQKSFNSFSLLLDYQDFVYFILLNVKFKVRIE